MDLTGPAALELVGVLFLIKVENEFFIAKRGQILLKARNAVWQYVIAISGSGC